MKMTVVPAQVPTVEDRIIGNLGFSQILLLITPVFASAFTSGLFPPFMGGALYKYIIMASVALLFCILAIRIKGKIVANWIITISRYNIRPRYYLYNKNVTTHREEYPAKTDNQESQKITEDRPKKKLNLQQLDIPTTARLLATIENPSANFRIEPGKKGNLHVRFTEIED
ncbi:MAG TPA: hypothetical protein PKD68_05285 [Candidatus Saccharibacteria bacterium]|nr:hypothetical protein [Candidatus Saccharibacteria bacterium]